MAHQKRAATPFPFFRSKLLPLGAPVFTEAGLLEQVHDQIPSKTSVALIVGPGGAIGRGVSFYGFTVASKSDSYLLLDRSEDFHDRTLYGVFTEDDKNELIAFMKSGKSEALDDTEIWETFFNFSEVRFWLGKADRERVISFLK